MILYGINYVAWGYSVSKFRHFREIPDIVLFWTVYPVNKSGHTGENEKWLAIPCVSRGHTTYKNNLVVQLFGYVYIIYTCMYIISFLI